MKTVHHLASQSEPTSPVGSASNESCWRSTLLIRLMPLVVWAFVLSLGCQPSKQTSNDANLSTNKNSSNTIIATSYPIQWVTRRIVDSKYEVNFPAGSSDNPDRWRPDRETISAIQSAELIICNGIAAPYAKWMKTVSLPSSKVVESASKGMTLADFISVDDIQIVHSHGPEGEHSHPTMVSRTWLDPMMLIKQANYITEQLAKRSPDNAAQFRQNLKTVTSELQSITPKVFPAETPPVFSATPELKFLTRAIGVVDLHFNWDEKTTLQQAEADLAARTEAQTIRFILFPKRLEILADRLEPVLQKRKLTPIFIDMLDREDLDRDLITRLGEDFEQLQTSLSDVR